MLVLLLTKFVFCRCFPSLEEFESSLSAEIILKSKQNFAKLLDDAKGGSIGLVPHVFVPEEPESFWASLQRRALSRWFGPRLMD